MDRVIRKISCLLITICIVLYVVNDFLGESLNIVNDVIIPGDYCETYYESFNNNTGVTTINGIGNAYYNFSKLGYSIIKEDITNDYVDVCFQKDDDIWRYYYEIDTGYIIFFNNKYELSFNGVTYIIERKDI